MAENLTLDRVAMKDRSTAHLRIYVGGITESVTVDDVYEHFIRFGKINGIVINRGFGFVQFDEEVSAMNAIKQADGSIIQGKQVNVRAAVSNPRREQELAQTNNQQEQNSSEPAAATPAAENSAATNDEPAEELYDNQGNYIGDQQQTDRSYTREDPYHEQEPYDNYGQGRDRGMRGRGALRGRGKPLRARGGGFRERSPIRRAGDWNDRVGFDRYQQPPMPEYPRTLPMPERNDCEIIVVSKGLTEYAEYLEGRLKRLGIVVDLLFPMEDVPIGKVLGNIASRGCLYAILVMPTNQENRSLTLNILHGLPQEHRNMPVEDALALLSRNFAEVQRGGLTGREAVYALLGQLADGRTLTALQYDKVIEYLQERREQQVKVELGEPLAAAANTKTQVDLQQRILSILNDKKVDTASAVRPVLAPVPAPPPAAPLAPAQNKLFNDPTVRKALDSILQKLG